MQAATPFDAPNDLTGNPEVEIDTNLSLLAYGMLGARRDLPPEN